MPAAQREHLINPARLKERLLKAGVAPRHVRRTLAELQDHYDDAVREESQKGADAITAEQNAWARSNFVTSTLSQLPAHHEPK